MAPKRILQVIGGLDNGGSQAMILNIYRKIDREKVQFDFIVDHPDEMYFASEVKALGGKIHIMPTFTGFNLQEILKAWNDFFITHPEYKIIHAHVRSYASIFLSIAKKHGLVTISHSHSTSSGKGLKAVVKNILQIRLRYVADYMMSCSYHAGEWLFGKKAADSERHFVINNAVDVPKYVYSKARSDEQREKWGIPDDAFVVGHVGRFCEVKNHSFIVDVFAEVLKKEQNAFLLLVGDGETLEMTKQKAKELCVIDRIVFTGQSEDVPELLCAMDVLMFPSLYEGLPVTLIEAQGTDLPCVVSDTVDEKSNIGGDFVRLPLEDSAEKWAIAVINAKKEQRCDKTELIVKNGYDISQTSEWIKEFYLSHI